MPVFHAVGYTTQEWNKDSAGSSAGQPEDLQHRPNGSLTGYGSPEEHI